MANTKISQLPIATNPTGEELIPVVQSGDTKQLKVSQVVNYIVPTSITFQADQTINLSDSTYDDSEMIRLSWTGATGIGILNLPDATQNTNRVMRFISNGGFTASTRVHLTPILGQTIDGSTSFYDINKEYEGIQVWSDGVQWFIIQKKA
jgi:hypothetical protein